MVELRGWGVVCCNKVGETETLERCGEGEWGVEWRLGRLARKETMMSL